MDYNFNEIEKKWQQYWRDNKIYKVDIDYNKPKFYVLDMFPYPSGAGLHVGHPLGYIASDIYARYKRLKGFNVLHPMGYDAYGLPAEQYAIQTGTHPAVTTEKNINRYREQMDKIGFCYDWDREVRTCEPGYYKWTQWTFIQLFKSFYCYGCQKAQPISKLIARFEEKGTEGLNVAESKPLSFTAAEWKAMSEKEQQEVLMNYRLAYQAEAMVNWCPGLGTVLANDEVADGLSVRGGFPVERKSMKQWQLRITAYADRLLQGLETVDWSESRWVLRLSSRLKEKTLIWRCLRPVRIRCSARPLWCWLPNTNWFHKSQRPNNASPWRNTSPAPRTVASVSVWPRCAR